jgi:hypothetical protein
MPNSNYDLDFYAWANEQASLLRAGKLSIADIKNIAEEIESIGRTEKRELVQSPRGPVVASAQTEVSAENARRELGSVDQDSAPSHYPPSKG